MNIILVVSLFFLVFTWFVYPLILIFFSNKKNESYLKCVSKLSISVLIAVHNEENNIHDRILNIIDIAEGWDIEIIVLSDNSIDNTLEIVKKFKKDNIIGVDIKKGRGRANAHNEGMRIAQKEIIIFTDADTIFHKNFFKKILLPFNNSKVGLVSGTLIWKNERDSSISNSAGFYWKYEMILRRLESTVGLYMFSTGACMAIRKGLYRNIPPTGDVDFTTPLDVIIQGYQCVHSTDAIAYDFMPKNMESEYRARVRMVTKNLHGSLIRWGVKNCFRFPLYTCVLFSHKILRWMTPIFLLGILGSSLTLYFLFGFTYANMLNLVVLLELCLLFFIMVGYILSKLQTDLYGFQMIYNFMVINIAFLHGIFNVLIGKIPMAYKK